MRPILGAAMLPLSITTAEVHKERQLLVAALQMLV
jgi:hypothetical protein